MNLEEFSLKNLERCEDPNGFNHKLTDWSLSDWMTALTGEVGEAANIVKKLNRIRDGISGNSMIRICPSCNTMWPHNAIRVQKCSCGKEIGDVSPVPDPQLEIDLKQKLANELADVFIYLDLMFQRIGVSMNDQVIETFNRKSAQIGYTVSVV